MLSKSTVAILAALKEDGLDIKNMVGLGTDGANTLIGHRSGVVTRLREHNSEIILVRCVCHLVHKAAEKPFNTLPCRLETLVREIYGYFRLSSCRKDRYSELCTQINGAAPRKLLKVHGVRWLSFYQCIDVILKQWDELVSFFNIEQHSGDHDRRYSARVVLDMLSDPQNRVYFTFCRWFLKPFIEKNLLFQRENADVLKLINELDMFYIGHLRKIVVIRQMENFQHTNGDMMQFDFERHLCHLRMVEFGIEFLERIDTIAAADQDAIKERCRSCLIEAARQVRDRLPCSLRALRLLESLESCCRDIRKDGEYYSIVAAISRLDTRYRSGSGRISFSLIISQDGERSKYGFGRILARRLSE